MRSGPKTIAIIACLDTKGVETSFVADIIRERGHRTLIIDVGIFESSGHNVVDISNSEIAHEGGAEIVMLRHNGDKARAMDAMTKGAAAVVGRLYIANRFDAIVGLGGSAGTVIGSSAMRALPFGVPKVLLSTVAAGNMGPYIGAKDLTWMYSVVDIAGLNRISTRVLANAAGAVVGMVETQIVEHEHLPLIVASMFGNTTPCVDRARGMLEAAGFEVQVFHATGTGGAAMERLIAEGYADGVLDITTTEWADELCGGVFSAGSRRLDAAALTGVPQVVAPGCLDMVNFGPPEYVPPQYAARQLYRWNPSVTLMRTDPGENRELGRIIAQKVNQSTGPVAVLLPLGGVSQLDSVEGEFWSPAADQALFGSMREHLRPDIPVIEVAANINDHAFADRAALTLLDLMHAK